MATRRALTHLSVIRHVTRQAARCLSLSCTLAEVALHTLRGSTGPHLATLPYHRSYVSLACLIRGRRFLPGARHRGSLAVVTELRPKPLPYLPSSPPLPCYHTRAPQRTTTQPAPLHSRSSRSSGGHRLVPLPTPAGSPSTPIKHANRSRVSSHAFPLLPGRPVAEAIGIRLPAPSAMARGHIARG
jgi:hypothetical protein